MAKLPIVPDLELLSDLSEASSYADARADTPTMAGQHQSDSEDTLSSLSFDEDGILSPTSGGSDLDLGKKSPVPNMLATVSSPTVTSFQPPPVPAPRTRLQGPSSGTFNHPVPDNTVPAKRPPVDIRINPAPTMDDHRNSTGSSDSVHLDLDLPSPTGYKAPTVDFPTSPSQLRLQLGPAFYPKEEEPGRVSEDDVSFASSCRAKLDLNFQNGGVRLTKRDDGVVFELSESEPPSIAVSESHDQLEDYIEDFYLPLSHESVMQRQQSFRRKVQQQLETAATERAVSELSKFETMLATYEEEEDDLSDLNSGKVRRNSGQKLHFDYDAPLQSLPYSEAPESLLDIDAICNTHAPNLMRRMSNDDASASIGLESEESAYFIPKTTIDKLYAVYDSTNFHNLYTLSGELRHILSPMEIEEIVANRVHLEKVIDPNVIAALSMPWSLNESSLPSYDMSLQGQGHEKVKVTEVELKDTPSKTSSISNGFHSRNTSDASDDEASTTSTPTLSGRCSSGFDTPDSTLGGATGDHHGGTTGEHLRRGFERGGADTASFRRRIALAKSLQEEMEGGIHKIQDDGEYNSISLAASPRSGSRGGSAPPQEQDEMWGSLESLNDLEIEDDSEGGAEDELCFVRRDSKRFGKSTENEERVVQGLFVETKPSRSCQGTLTRVRVPLNLSQIEMDEESSSPSKEDYVYLKKHPKKRISLDASVLRTTSLTDLEDSSQATDADVTLSEVFHSCLSGQRSKGESPDDLTIRSNSGATTEEDVTLDLDTPDDMADSILGRLESLSASGSSVGLVMAANVPDVTSGHLGSADLPEFKSFSVGLTEIQIDLRAIQPYRRVISHGGYFDAEKKVAIILFSGCFLPDRSRREYLYIMDQLFLYCLSSLEELIVDDYILVYLHGATPKSSQPSFGWLKRCYQLLDRKLRKNLKGLYLVHPSFWLRTVVALTKPFVSSKFSSKVQFVNTLAELCLELPTEHLVIPEPVLQYDFDQKVSALKRHMM